MDWHSWNRIDQKLNVKIAKNGVGGFMDLELISDSLGLDRLCDSAYRSSYV